MGEFFGWLPVTVQKVSMPLRGSCMRSLWLFAVSLLPIPGLYAQTQFTDVSDSSGVGIFTESYGASWGDLNGDAYPDLFANNHRFQPSLYLNMGDGSFYDTGSQVHTWVNRQNADTHGGSFADFDNDGDQDLLITTGTGNPNQFFVNDNGALIDKSVELGVDFDNLGGRLPIWLDYNGDQLLDIVITQFGGAAKLFTQTATGFSEDSASVGLLCLRFQYGHLYDVDENGRLDFLCPDDAVFPQKIYDTLPLPWNDITSLFPTITQVSDSVIADFDNNQQMDMFVISNAQLRPSTVLQVDSNTIEANLTNGEKGFNFISNGPVTFNLYWNKLDNPDGLSRIRIGSIGFNPFSVPFTLDPNDPNVAGITPLDPAAAPIMHIGYDPATQRWTVIAEEGDLSSQAYYVVTTEQPITDLQATGMWPGDFGGTPTLIMNGDLGFTDETVSALLGSVVQCASATAGDFDNDMDVDLYLACRTGASNLENLYYDNKYFDSLGDRNVVEFELVANAGGAAGQIGSKITSGAGNADSVINADYDVDGFLDLFVTNGLGLRPKEFGGQNKLFRNQGNTNHWIELDLVGTASSREPVGARVTATAGGVTQLRVYNGGYHRWSQEPRRMHFGLAAETTVDLTVEWPSGITENYPGVSADQLYEITEGTGIVAVIPGENAQPYSCGPPAYDPGTEAGVFIWRDCLLDTWRFRFAAGGPTFTRYNGRVVSAAGFASVSPHSLESNDVLDSTTDPLQIAYQLGMVNSGVDGFDVVLAPDSNACFELDSPAAATVYYGPFREVLTAPFDVLTGGVCGAQLPDLSVADVVVSESAAQADFTLTLAEPSASTVTVDVSTMDGSATAGSDYTALPLTTVSFAPGEVSKTVSVAILDDLLGEGSETFSLVLSNPVNATLVLGGGAATITDNEVSACGEPAFNAGTEVGAFIWKNCTTGQWQVRMTAGGSATTVTYSGSIVSNLAFSQVTPFSNESNDVLDSTTNPLQIDYQLKMVNAGVDGVDFMPAAGAAVCFEMDSAPGGAAVYVGADRAVFTPPFDLETLGACGGLLPSLTVADLAVSEAAGQVDVLVSLSEVSTSTVTVDVVSADGSAVAGEDYTAQPPLTITFAPGETSKTVSIPILEDSLSEGDETFLLAFSNATNASLGTPSSTVTISDNEISPCGEPAINAGSEAGVFIWKECATDQWHMRVAGGGVFQIYRGSIVSTAPYSIVTGFSIDASDTLDFTTDPMQIAYELKVSGAGQDGVDFVPAAGASSCLHVDAPTTAIVYVGQSKSMVTQPFDLETLAACGGLLPTLGIEQQTVNEADGQALVTVNLSASAPDPVTVDIHSSDGSALAGADYIALPVTSVTLEPGQVSKSVAITLLDDTVAEGDESLALTLSNPQNATLGVATADLIISDNEASPCGEPVFDAATEAGVFVWKDCATGQWHMRASPGGVVTTYTGSIASSSGFTQISGFSLETSDVLDTTTDPTSASYQLTVSGGGQDGVDFTPAAASSTCFAVDAPAAATVYVGSARTVVTAPFDLTTLAACGQLPSLSVNDTSVSESSGSALFTVSLSAPSDVPVSVSYTTLDGTASSPDDYGFVADIVTIPAGEMSATVSVPVVNDSLIETDENFSLTISTPVAATIGKAAGVATIIDDDSAVLSIDSVSAVETAGTMMFTVSLSAANLVPVTVDYATADATATAGADYTAIPLTTLTFDPGDVSKTIAVTLLDDADTEGDETFTLTLSNAAGAGVQTAVGVGTITDSEPLPVLSVSDAVANESAATMTFGVALSTPSTQPVTVDYVSSDGTAVAGSDYTAVPLSTLTFAPGETTASINVGLLDDTDIEQDETFNIALSGPTRAALGVSVATGTINDDESRPTLTMSDVTANETDGTMLFTANLSTASALPVTVDYASSDGTAVSPGDYNAVSGTLTFPPGTTTQTVSVTLFDDAEQEFDESFSIELSNPVEVNLDVSSVLATVVDDESLVCGEPSYDPATEAVIVIWQDCATTGDWHIRMTAGGGAFISYPGKLESNQGYSQVSGVSIESGDFFEFNTSTDPTSVLFTLGMSPPGFDGIDFSVSSDATVCFNVNLPAGSSMYVGASRYQVFDTSLDLKSLGPCTTLPQLSVSDVAVIENQGLASFVLNLSAPSSVPVSVDYQTLDGTATAGLDYTALPLSTLTFNPGEVSKTIDVTLLDDSDIEPTEAFTLELDHIVNASLGIATISSAATATISDDEVAPTFSVGNVSALESDGSITATVTLVDGPDSAVSVDVETVDGSAAAGLDYVALPLTTLTFAPGETSKAVVLTLLDDVLAEGPEAFQVELSNAVGGLINGATATLGVDDNEPSPCGQPVFDVATESALFIWKDCASGQWSTRYTGGDSYKIFSGRVTSTADLVSVTPVSIENTDVLDFVSDPAVIEYSLRVGAANQDGFDFLLPAAATACVELDLPAGMPVYLGAARTALTAPFDLANLGLCGSVQPSVSVSDLVVDEDIGLAGVTITLSAPNSTPVSVDYLSTDGTAVQPGDYTAVSASVTIPAGATSQVVQIPIIDDADFEPSESFSLGLSNLTGAVPGTLTATITITDNEAGALLAIDDVIVNETATQADLTVSLSAASATTVTVDVVTTDGSAVATDDYTPVAPTTLTFLPGETSTNVPVMLVDDNLAEGDENFTVELSNPVNALVSKAIGTVSITDNEPSPCGVPVYDAATESALFMWKDCTTGRWSARYTGGTSFKVFTGRISSSVAMASVTPFSLESTDVLDNVTDPAVIEYSLRVGAGYEDGFDFETAAGTTACVELDLPTGTPVYIGAARTLIAAPFDIATLAGCGI
jgi:hypothetical protein